MRLLHVPDRSAAGNLPSVAGQAAFPKDIYPETGNRFPAINPQATDSFGPGPIRQYSPPVAESMTAVNDYLRRKSGFAPRRVEAGDPGHRARDGLCIRLDCARTCRTEGRLAAGDHFTGTCCFSSCSQFTTTLIRSVGTVSTSGA